MVGYFVSHYDLAMEASDTFGVKIIDGSLLNKKVNNRYYGEIQIMNEYE